MRNHLKNEILEGPAVCLPSFKHGPVPYLTMGSCLQISSIDRNESVFLALLPAQHAYIRIDISGQSSGVFCQFGYLLLRIISVTKVYNTTSMPVGSENENEYIARTGEVKNYIFCCSTQI